MAHAASWLAALMLALLVEGYPEVSAGEPLHDAARSGDGAAIGTLIASGASLEALDERGDTPLIAAAYSGRRETVVRLLDAGASITGRSDRGMTALHAAAYRGHLEIVSLLLDRGADIDDQENRFRITPLHAAAEENHLAVVELLISRGAALDLGEANGLTPLTRAGWKGNWTVFEAIRKAGAKCQPIAMTGETLYDRCTAIDP